VALELPPLLELCPAWLLVDEAVLVPPAALLWPPWPPLLDAEALDPAAADDCVPLLLEADPGVWPPDPPVPEGEPPSFDPHAPSRASMAIIRHEALQNVFEFMDTTPAQKKFRQAGRPGGIWSFWLTGRD
jgi:hypothetical protein